MTSSAASETDSARNLTPGRSGATALMIASPFPSGRCTSSRTTSRVELLDQRHGIGDRPGLADDVDAVAELRADAGEEQAVIVDEDDAPFHRGSLSSTSVPAPGALVTTELPPARSRRPLIDSRIPCLSPGTAAGSKPAPRSRTKTAISSSVTSA